MNQQRWVATMSTGHFQFRKALQVFGTTPEQLEAGGISLSQLPPFARSQSDNRQLKSWSMQEMPAVGARVGFMKKPARPVAAAVFVTKGGVLKSSLTLNLARTAALHGIRTCVVGLDMQGDVTAALGDLGLDDESGDSLDDVIEKLNSVRGLADIYTGDASLDDVLQSTDLPGLFYVPETPELVALDQSLIHRNRREYWLHDSVIEPLKRKFDLVLMDCSPNWNRLITNALVACDVLISPLECKINNFRNLRTFRGLMNEFRRDMRANFRQVFVPTRLAPTRKLSREIYEWYRANLANCAVTAIRESTQGEESMAMRQSLAEYAPTAVAADEMRELIREVWAIARDAAVAESAARTPESAVSADLRL